VIRSVGKLGPLKVCWLVWKHMRWDLLAIFLVAAALIPIPDAAQIDYAAAVLSVLGIGARCSSLPQHHRLQPMVGGPHAVGQRHHQLPRHPQHPVCGRLRRTRNGPHPGPDAPPSGSYSWQLAAELRGITPVPGVVELTPEDPADASAVDLMTGQAVDIAALSAAGNIDHQPASC